MAARLVLQPNDTIKDVETQLKQINMCLQDTQNWSNGLPSNLAINYKEPVQDKDTTTDSANYKDIPNFSFNFVINNTLCLLNFSLALKGNGVVGVIINGQLVQEVYFQTTGFTPVLHNAFYNLKQGNNIFQLQWRALGGSTISKANTKENLGLNLLQLVSFS